MCDFKKDIAVRYGVNAAVIAQLFGTASKVRITAARGYTVTERNGAGVRYC